MFVSLADCVVGCVGYLCSSCCSSCCHSRRFCSSGSCVVVKVVVIVDVVLGMEIVAEGRGKENWIRML